MYETKIPSEWVAIVDGESVANGRTKDDLRSEVDKQGIDIDECDIMRVPKPRMSMFV